MSLLAALAVALRVALILIAASLVVTLRSEMWAVVRQSRGWTAHLSTTVFVTMVFAGAVISSVNVFPDAGWEISRNLRLSIVNVGLSIFIIGALTGIYRRALRAGPTKARGAFLAGLALLIPGGGLVWLLMVSGAHG